MNLGQFQSQRDEEIIAFCDTLLQSYSALRFVPSAAMLQQMLQFARFATSSRVIMATVDAVLTSCRAIGVPRWRLCTSAGDNDEMWDLLCFSLAIFAQSTNHLGTPTRTSSARRSGSTRGRLRARRGRRSVADAGDSESVGDDWPVVSEADDVAAAAAASLVAAHDRDKWLELLRFFATLFEIERSTPAASARPTLAHLLLLRDPEAAFDAMDHFGGLTRAEKRHVARVEKLTRLVIRCFRCIEYVENRDDDVPTPMSARVVVYAQQLFHALNSLVDDDFELQQVVSHAALAEFNFLPTTHTQVLFVESMRHRAQKLRWLDSVLTTNFLTNQVPRKKQALLQAPSVSKFAQVYMYLKYSTILEQAALRSLDLFVLLLMHVAQELVEIVRQDRKQGVQRSYVLESTEKLISSNGTSTTAVSSIGQFEKIWRDDLRADILRITQEDRPYLTDGTLFRLDLLEHALDELSLAQCLKPE
jgi:hypothetical protein